MIPKPFLPFLLIGLIIISVSSERIGDSDHQRSNDEDDLHFSNSDIPDSESSETIDGVMNNIMAYVEDGDEFDTREHDVNNNPTKPRLKQPNPTSEDNSKETKFSSHLDQTISATTSQDKLYLELKAQSSGSEESSKTTVPTAEPIYSSNAPTESTNDKEHGSNQPLSRLDVAEGERLYNQGMKLMEEADMQSSSRKLAFQFMYEASEKGHLKAREFVALGTLLGWGFFQSLPRAHAAFTELANQGNPRGQFGLAVMYAAGFMLNASVPHTLVYLTFSALGGDELGEMALAYRYWSGIGVEENCETALTYYYRVAKKVTAYISTRADAVGPTYLGPVVLRTRLIDEVDSGTGPFSGLFGGGEPSANRDSNQNDLEVGGITIDEDLFQYYQFIADKKNISAQVGIALLYYHGRHGVEKNRDKAVYYFTMAAQGGSATAKAYLGEMYLNGVQPFQVDYKKALAYLNEAAEGNNAVAQASLALIYLYGKAGVKPNAVKALELMIKAANQGLSEAQLHLGRFYLSGAVGSKPDYKQALRYFTLASQQGNILAFYHIGEMHATGSGVIRSCNTATELFKNVAERGRWSHWLMYAYSAYRSRLYDEAFATYHVLAELGYEVAQSNVAFMLEEGRMSIIDKSDRYHRAFVQWQRSTNQGSTSSRLKLGDYHYYGLGTEVSYTRAVMHYRIASDVEHNPQAMFNLAYMHEQGLGLKRDLHLAKRFYDLAAETSLEAKVPVYLALTRLSFYFGLEYLRQYPMVLALERMFYGSDDVAPQEVGLSGETAESPRTFSEASMDWDYYVIPLLAGVLLAMVIFLWLTRR